MCLGSDLAWSRSRGLLADREPSYPAHKHCWLSLRVKGLRAVRPALRPVDFRSSEILLLSYGRLIRATGSVVDPIMANTPRSITGRQKRKHKGWRDQQDQPRGNPLPKGNWPKVCLMEEIMKRILCQMWGCCCSNEYPGCVRCGAALYDADFIQIGHLDWLVRLRSSIVEGLSYLNRKCAVCGKRMWFKGQSSCCSEKCESEWYPF